ncbi:flagellar FlbD family protein [Diplocloster agilis]|mgnify:CR=1 FL=1|uniref:Flagellar FlbD family protein n=1 Tax=Diplocloster agilis TaxID=2850323 RepID=A0A949K306_9FIRM|nr:flagellar FlbD family protein [Suonthocola fibrivorans]MBU9739289.1 flagellar FlbD family protein [Diplocloster agilis]MBU9744672.1 flagellar FlbD family protein [Diplocloster agilis]MCU6734545.1 flagellar FlbD family protein [Suonthocola fibrivorans]SCJ44167.1 Flagellar protein (FlbD) [uncultured Clostridium sp.]
MIILTKLNGEKFALNNDLIETITENPDTTILLTNGKHLLVRERMEEVIEKTAAFRRKTFTDLLDGIRRQDSEE